MHACSPRRALPSLPRGTTGARVAHRRAGGLQPAMRLRPWGSPSICARASRWQGWASFRTSRLPRSTHCWPTPRPTLAIFLSGR
ncbi:hypothetical protein T492DRAFT_1078919, partial [Pavlovales sp. CCMP2436]